MSILLGHSVTFEKFLQFFNFFAYVCIVIIRKLSYDFTEIVLHNKVSPIITKHASNFRGVSYNPKVLFAYNFNVKDQ